MSMLENKNPNLDDFYEAWWWLMEHPAFFFAEDDLVHNEPGFEEQLSIFVTQVDLETGRMPKSPDAPKKVVVWVESGGWSDEQKNLQVHDYRLDSCGDSFEEAIIALAKVTMEHYGDYPQYSTCSHCLKNEPSGPIDENVEWFCSESCRACGKVTLKTEPVENSTLLRWIPPNEQFDCEHWNAGAKV